MRKIVPAWENVLEPTPPTWKEVESEALQVSPIFNSIKFYVSRTILPSLKTVKPDHRWFMSEYIIARHWYKHWMATKLRLSICKKDEHAPSFGKTDGISFSDVFTFYYCYYLFFSYRKRAIFRLKLHLKGSHKLFLFIEHRGWRNLK